MGAIICKSKNKWYYDVGKHKAHPLLLLLLCLAACFLGRPYDYWEVYGIKPWARKFYNSKEWEQCRQAYIASKQGLCERCLAQGRISPGEIVHHKEWLTQETIGDPSVTLNFDNLELLCWDCHNKEHGKQLPIAEGMEFDESGNLRKKY